DYFLLLNPDTFFESNFVVDLLAVMEADNSIGIACPILKYPDGRIQTTWKMFPSFANVVKKRLGVMKAEQEFQMKGPIIEWCLGACMLISTKLMKNGQTLLDERYRLY